MKKLLCALLALGLLAGTLPPALSDALIVEAIEENAIAPEAVPEEDGLLVLEEGAAESGNLPSEAEDALLAEVQDASGEADGGEALLADLAGGEETALDPLEIDAPSGAPVALEATDTVESDLNSDDLFAGYVNRILYGGTLRRAMATARAGAYLSGQSLNLYNALRPYILKVAAGELSSTEFRVPASEILGGDTFTPEAYSAMMADGWQGTNVNAWSNNQVTQALWLDCTYELYWFKRYKSDSADTCFGVSSLYYSEPLYLGDDGLYHVYDGMSYSFRFAVLDRYSGGADYTVDTGLIQGAQAAAENARAIVSRYAGYSDYAKLLGFAYEISALVDYNDDAILDDWDGSQQDPWKLIWVFDGDPATNVVCEGYAQAFQYLCELASFTGDIRCTLVTGDAGGDHAWNLVRMEDGLNYVVDVTWMDGRGLDQLTGSMADWINGDEGYLFLCGGTGSPKGGYVISYRGVSGSTTRTYRQIDTLNLYPESALTLAERNYILNGWQTVAGSRYYFDDGRYVTGIREINGINYEFSTDGTLLSSKITGWREIDGARVYFDSNGTLHTGWLTDGGARYYFDGQGAMCVGWVNVDGERLLFESDGALHTVHTPVTDAAVAPTCEADGLTEGSHCALCGAVFAAQEPIPAIGHSWGETSYVWTGDSGSVTATRVCAHDPAHVESETVWTAATARAATCEAPGEITYVATFANEAFARQVKAERIPATGHAWGAPSYAWAADGRSVTATRVCAHDATHTQSETVRASAAVTRAATCVAPGQTTYTAKFKSAAFAAQTRAAEDIPATGHTPVTDKAVAATYTRAGLTKGSHCAVCGAVLAAQQTVPMLDCTFHMKKSATKKVKAGVPIQIVVDNQKVKSYKSSDKKIASVSSKGRVTTKMAGTAKITITLKNKKKLTLTVKVTDANAPKSIKITKGAKATLKAGKKLTLKTKLNPTKANTYLTWTTSNKKVATVSSKGVVTAKKKGTAKITVATANGKKATIKIIVK